MGAILRGCSITLCVVMLHSQAVADVTENQDALIFSADETVLADELDDERGREGVDMFTLNNMNIRATLSGNQANQNMSGYNSIDGGSFGQASGITSVIQNSGNNVVIQNATNVNVTIMH